MQGINGKKKKLNFLVHLTCWFVFPEAENKTQSSIPKPHMDMLREDLVYGGGKKKSLMLLLKCLFSEGIAQHL